MKESIRNTKSIVEILEKIMEIHRLKKKYFFVLCI